MSAEDYTESYDGLSMVELIEQFGSEDRSHEALEELRWPTGVKCPRCDSKAISRIVKRRQFDCDGCRYQFSVRVGTVLQDSKLPLWKWFLAIYMMCESKKSVSANQLKRILGVSYKTAWFLCHRIRAAMVEDSPSWLKGTVEMDETYIGGRIGGPETMFKDKTIVVGAVQRGGKARLRVVPDRRTRTLKKFAKEFISADAKAIYTDALPAYTNAVGSPATDHQTVTHRNNEWVHGKIHTNTVEGVFSLLDRSIMGAYHKVSNKHLPAYLHEVEWRFNNRKNPYLFRDTLMKLVRTEPVEYKSLTR
jgi:transposase-like protein